MRTKFILSIFIFFFSLKAYGQSCTLSVSLTSAANTICSGNSVQLTATPTNGLAPYIYIWSTGETTPSINVNKAGTYFVSVSDNTPGCQPVKKSITISVSETPDQPTVQSQTICPNSSATLAATAPGGAYQWYDAATGGNFLGTGATYTTPLLTQATIFYVETTLNVCTSARTAVTVNITGNPVVHGATVCYGTQASLSATGGESYTWYATASVTTPLGTGPNFTTPPLIKTTVYYVAAVINGCQGTLIPVTAVVGPSPVPPTSSNTMVCYGMAATLHASIQYGEIDWFDVPAGGEPLITSPDFTTPPLTVTTTYYVQSSANGCESGRTPVTITVEPLPATPVVQNAAICAGSAAVLTATSPGNICQWLDAGTGNILAIGNTFNTPILNSSITYYVRAVNGSCVSATVPVIVNVNLPPQAPTAAGILTCSGSSATLTATLPGGTYQWYDSPTSGNLLETGNSYTTLPLTKNAIYYVQTTVSGCISPRTAVAVGVLPALQTPSAASTIVCAGSVSVLTALGPGGEYSWYDSATGGNLLFMGKIFVTKPLLATTNFYIETTVNGCVSERGMVTASVISYPSTPIVNSTTICPGSSAVLTANASANGVLSWYDSATGGNLLATGNTFKTPPLSLSTTYYVENTAGSCASLRVPVSVSVYNVPTTQFLYQTEIIFTSDKNQSPSINNTYGGTFSATPSGLVFVNNKTGQINTSASTPGKYTITFTSNDPCGSTFSSNIIIAPPISNGFEYGGPFCQAGNNPLPALPAGTNAGAFSAKPTGLVFVSDATGQINLAASKAGTYTVIATVTLATGGAFVDSSQVIIDPQAIVSTGLNQVLPIGAPVQLAGSITGGTTGGTWSGGSGTFSNPNLLNAVYTPSPKETIVKLVLMSNDPPGVCGPQSDTVTVNFGIRPPAPTALGATVCAGGNANLNAVAPGGMYQWYDAATGGKLLSTGPVYLTPPLASDTTYYVQTTLNGIISARTGVAVIVNPMPIAPIVATQPVCSGNQASLTATGNTAGSYQWYDQATGGNLLSVNNTFLTPPLTANTTYYVQSTTNGCSGTRTQVDLTVVASPAITSPAAGVICSGNTLSYTITANITSATFNWSRAQVAGISNPPLSGQTSATINETLINTSHNDVNVTYLITPFANGCPGPVFNYVITVHSTDIITSSHVATICTATSSDYAIATNSPGVEFYWNRAAIPGITNAAVTNQATGTIRELLFNTTNAPINVSYIITYQTNNCNDVPFNLTVTVNPTISITSAGFGMACSGSPQNYAITSNVPSATFSWKRSAIPQISNPAVYDQTDSTISETLLNTGNTDYNVFYIITPTAFGCQGYPFNYIVAVHPQLQAPVVESNSPVCQGSSISLNTLPVDNATYLWTGPDGFTSSAQNPVINNIKSANAGTYYLNIMLNGCTSPTDSVSVAIKNPPIANAGLDTLVCVAVPAIPLHGTVSGGTTTGIWTTSGTGTFSPTSNTLNGQYIPSEADRAGGYVTITLTSTSTDNCTIATSDVIIKFGEAVAVFAGNNQNVCSQTTNVQLNGKIIIPGGGVWSTSGGGSFRPSATDLNAQYIPTADDIKNDSVTLTLTANAPGQCYLPSGQTKILFLPPPNVNAGGTRYVLAGWQITLNPIVSDPKVQYLWTPNIDINNNTLQNPEITGNVDCTYTLTVTDSLGCVSQGQTFIKVSPKLVVPSAFTPNGDGINDKWDIEGLIAYANATLDVFNRYGVKVFHSNGYYSAWDGTYNGKPVPVGVYYYIINTNFFGQVISGPVTIIR